MDGQTSEQQVKILDNTSCIPISGEHKSPHPPTSGDDGEEAWSPAGLLSSVRQVHVRTAHLPPLKTSVVASESESQ